LFITVTKNVSNTNQLKSILWNSLWYIIFHGQQTSMSIVVILIQRECPCVVWLVFTDPPWFKWHTYSCHVANVG